MRRVFVLLCSLAFCLTKVCGQGEATKSYGQGEATEAYGLRVLAYQRVTGGWPKNIDMEAPLSQEALAAVMKDKQRTDDSTIDNGATTSQMRVLALLYRRSRESRWRKGFGRGLEYLLAAQYENGGWPQFWPDPKGYKKNITFNDNAMVNVLTLLKDIYEEKPPFDGGLVSDKVRERVRKAFDRGIECILNCQIRTTGQDGEERLTVWCQQHDPVSLSPANARSYELASYFSHESAGIVGLLMSLTNPDERIRRSIEGALRWFDTYKLTEPDGKVRWARFYDLEHCEPFFCDRDGVPKRRIEDIGDERRYGYAWYSDKDPLALTRGSRLPYSLRMVRSEMKRTAKSYLLDFSSKPKWSYVMGIELEAMLDAYLRYGGEDIWDYIEEYPMTMIDSSGNTVGYRYEDFNLDNIRPAKFVLRMFRMSPFPGGKEALDRYLSQLRHQPRTQDGPFWHKKIYHDQVWLDGIFMGLPFYVMMDAGAYDDAVDQMLTTGRLTFDKKTGLWKHAYDEKRRMFWADPVTGQSEHTWARALGWYAMAMVEVLDVLPQDYVRRGEVVRLFRKAMKAVRKCQDRESGVWFDVLDVEDSRNYLESTASCMFAYCMLKGARLGYLDKKYLEAGKRAYDGIIREFVRENADGTISLTGCCSVSGLGPESAPRRDGSFEYYMSEPVRDNDAKGIGPFIWASLEMERLI